MFVTEQTGCVPDMLVLGKGLGGGIFPLAALLAREDLDVAADRALGHYTHEKSPVGCAAALATLDILRDEGLVERARRLGVEVLGRLEAMAARQPAIRATRGLGLYWGVRLADPALADQVLYRCLEAGLSFKIGGGDVVTLCPPLTIAQADLDRALAILERAINHASAA